MMPCRFAYRVGVATPIAFATAIGVSVEVLSFKNSDDLVRSRVDDENLIANQNEAVRPPFWINFNHSCRQWVQRYAARHYSAD